MLSAFSEILDSTGQYKDFKNTDDRFFTLYDFEDVWLINWETKAHDILER